MEKDKHITEVMFRKDKSGEFKGDITAVFPYEIATISGLVEMYAHIGQHTFGSYAWVLEDTVPAPPQEYQDLQKELEGLGYNLRIIKRRNHKRFINELNKSRK